eukprot:CAMPEP_0181286900 /NCGR_PEP_ID=MMETSP1097-20121128/16855_1 /TAXON_ID=35684 /ORGANISM="Pseudopedinella elastica, Strain CCMP716" /LENGTH=162 /DNA_ID=CAMNT_0023390775 /DNA_START=124 /DNA_END=613 /DNA_ORIENTATION=+
MYRCCCFVLPTLRLCCALGVLARLGPGRRARLGRGPCTAPKVVDGDAPPREPAPVHVPHRARRASRVPEEHVDQPAWLLVLYLAVKHLAELGALLLGVFAYVGGPALLRLRGRVEHVLDDNGEGPSAPDEGTAGTAETGFAAPGIPGIDGSLGHPWHARPPA